MRMYVECIVTGFAPPADPRSHHVTHCRAEANGPW